MGEGYESSDTMRMLIWAKGAGRIFFEVPNFHRVPNSREEGGTKGPENAAGGRGVRLCRRDGGRRVEHQSQAGGSSGSRWAEIAASTSFAKSESNTLPEAIRFSGALFLPLD